MSKAKRFIHSKRGVDFPSSTMLYLVLIALAFLFLLGSGARMYMLWVEDKKVDERCRATLIANSVLRFPDKFRTMEGVEEERVAADCVRGEDVTIKYSKVKANSGTQEAIKFNILKEIALEGVSCDYKYMGDIRERVPFSHEAGMYCGMCNDIKMDDKIKREFALVGSGDDTFKLKDFYTYLINNRNPRSGNFFSEDLYGFSKSDNSKQNFDRLMTARLKQLYGKECSKYKVDGSCDRLFSSVEDNQLQDYLKKFDTDIDPTHTYNWVHIVRKDDRVIQKIQSNIHKQDMAGLKLFGCGAIIAVGVGGAALTAGASLVVTGALVGGGEVLVCTGSLVDLLIGQIPMNGLSDYQPLFVMNTVLVDQKDFASLGCDHVYGISKESVKKK